MLIFQYMSNGDKKDAHYKQKYNKQSKLDFI